MREADEVFVFPTTVRQQGFWYLDQLQPGNPAYNIAVRFRLQGRLRVEVLERALNEIVRRHEALRTVFAVQAGVPVQVVIPQLAIRLPQNDLSEWSDPKRRERAEMLTAEEARRSFDLNKGPLLRARLLRLQDDEHILLVTVHHLVADGWSIGVLTQELGVLYDAYCREQVSPLAELSLHYADFAVWQKAWLETDQLGNQLRYWTEQLTNLPTLEIPTDRPRPLAQTFHGAIESILLPRLLTDGLATLSKAEKATPFMVILAAFQVLLQRCTGQNDICVGSVLAGRSRVELESLIGLFINPLVFRTDLSGDPPFLELLARVRETVVAAFAHQDVPFERVVDAVQPKRDPSRHPLFQVNLLYQRDFVQPFRAAELTLKPIPSLSPGAIYDLNFFLVERAEGWRASCEYNTDLYEVATIRHMLEQFHNLLEEITANPACRLSGFALTRRVPAKLLATPAGQPVPSTADASLPPPSAPSEYVGPRDAVEVKLAEMWERLLGMRGMSVTADFFDAGGHSLLAAQLLAQVGKAFGKKVPLAGFLQGPTIAALAARLRKEKTNAAPEGLLTGQDRADGLDEERWKIPTEQVFPLRHEGTRPPLLIVDAGPFQRPLVRRLGNEQPVWGLALPELSALPKGFTVKDIAANLVEALAKTQLEGPYHLAGWSMAGNIAYEIAQQLRQCGQEVGLLILFDTVNPNYLRSFTGWRNYPIRVYFWLEKLLYHLGKMRGMSWRKAWQYFRERMHRFRPERMASRPGLGVDVPTSEREFVETWKIQYLTAGAYQPEPCDWPLVLVRSRALQTGWFRDPQMGWEPLARRGLQVFEMRGEHDTMFREPEVQRLAAIVKACVQEVNSTERSEPFTFRAQELATSATREEDAS